MPGRPRPGTDAEFTGLPTASDILPRTHVRFPGAGTGKHLDGIGEADYDAARGPVAAVRRRMRVASATWRQIWTKLYRFYLLPGEPFLTWWDWFMVLVSVSNGVSISFMVAFRYLYIGSFVGQLLIDLLYLVDIFLKFHVSYLEQGFYVIFPAKMAMHYMRSWEFSFDLVTNLPVDLIAVGWIGQPDRALYYLALCRLPKLLRTLKLVWWFHKEETRLNSQAVFQLYKFTIYITLITHWCTCIWYVLACPEADTCVSPSWATDPDQSPTYADRLSMYIYALYWTVMTMTTTGYGDVHATNDRERVWSIVCMITGVFLYGYVSGTITSSLSNLDSRRVSYRQKVEAIKQYMLDQNMDKAMQKRVTGWYEYTWERNKGIDVINVFNDLPTNFRAEVALSLNEDILDKVPMFKDTSLGFRRMLSIAMRINFFTADTFVVHRGEIGKEMFFVVQGRVDMLNDGGEAMHSMVEGSFFGEYMLILGYTCEASAKAVCNCDVYVLCDEDYRRACHNYPEDAAKVLAATKEAYATYQQRRQKQQRGNQRKQSTDFDLEDFGGVSGTFGTLTRHGNAHSGSGGGGGTSASNLPPLHPGRSSDGLSPSPTAPTSRRPSFGYLVMGEDDQKRLDQIKHEKRRKSVAGSKFSMTAHQERIKPVEDGVRYVGTLGRSRRASDASTTAAALLVPGVMRTAGLPHTGGSAGSSRAGSATGSLSGLGPDGMVRSGSGATGSASVATPSGAVGAAAPPALNAPGVVVGNPLTAMPSMIMEEPAGASSLALHVHAWSRTHISAATIAPVSESALDEAASGSGSPTGGGGAYLGVPDA
ncbi:hypothetical protein GGF31_005233 [Allomyces arbusculus]|nr:hypothetical protein GGF31_005233 [Allomyces arbusculus]